MVTRCMVLTFCATFVIGYSIAPAQSKPHHRRTRVEISALTDATTRHFSIDTADIFQINTGGISAADQLGYMAIEVPIEGTTYTLDLAPHSIRADSYQVVRYLEDGSMVQLPSGPVRTLRGTVVGLADSLVAASMGSDGLTAKILLADGNQYAVEPIHGRVEGSRPGDHAIYFMNDIQPHGGVCATPHANFEPMESGSVSAGGTIAGALFLTELAIEVDSLYFLQSIFQLQDNPLAAMEEHINNIINVVNLQYEQDLLIRHVITRLIIRETVSTDPYQTQFTFTELADVVLGQFRELWTGSLVNVPRDVAQLFTGRDLASRDPITGIITHSTIGIAFLQSVCLTGTHYSVVQPTCCSTFGCKTDLSAHELGHNWGARHCGGNSCTFCQTTMNCSLRCANNFNQTSINEITGIRDTRTCLDMGDELRRIAILSDTNIVIEDSTLQLTAIADFRFGEDQDVTTQVIWSVDPPEAGFVDETGLYSASPASGNICTTVTAIFNDGEQDHTNSKIIVVEDMDIVFGLLESNPPDGTIIAGQTSEPNGTSLAGLSTVDVTFNGDTCLLNRFDFVVTHNDASIPPFVESLESITSRKLRLNLRTTLLPGVWADINFNGQNIRLGHLPVDMNADAITDSDDLFTLMDVLNGTITNLPLTSVDIDRSGAVGVADLLRAIDLLNGAGVYEVWFGRSLQ